jgi:transposase
MSSRKKRKKKKKNQVIEFDVLSQINLHAAGLDVHSQEIWAAVPVERDPEPVQKFGTFTPDLYDLADWLAACNITTVAMESTGVYWIAVFQILEERGFEVILVNARYVKNVAGPKSDWSDCQWLQKLHTFGLLHASFRPEHEVCALRSLVRQRKRLIEDRVRYVQRMQKALVEMNLQLTIVLSDITGVTGMSIIRHILQGQRDPVILAQFRDARCKRSEEDIVKALQGDYRPEHLFALQQAVAFYDFFNQQIALCDQQIEAQFDHLSTKVINPDVLTKPRRRRKRKNDPAFDLHHYLYQWAGVDLTAIDGLDALSLLIILSETGVDMSKWPTVKHFTSWLRLAPHNDQSASKKLRSYLPRTQNRAHLALRHAALSLKRSSSAFGHFFRRIEARRGTAVAVVATAHKLARIVYFMLKEQTEFAPADPEKMQQRSQQRALRRLQRLADKLGAQVVIPDPQPAPT